MDRIVCKFGGSSLADADGFRRAREIVEARRERRFIVLSAPGKRFDGDTKVTDLLAAGEIEAAQERFDKIAVGLGLAPMDLTLSRFEGDALLSRGEYGCAKLFAQYIGFPFVDAARLFFFDEQGHFLQRKSFAAIREAARRCCCVVIPGFYGANPDGSIRLFPRGGSDISAAWVAAALRADLYENWTDVSGVMTADPRLCSGARPLHHIGCRQMERLSEAGARVLHPDSIAPVRRANVPISLKNTFAPHAPGTYIAECIQKTVPCAALRNNALTVFSPNREVLERILAAIPHDGFRMEDDALTLEVQKESAVELLSAAHKMLFY